MKVRQMMTAPVIRISPEESVEVAARTLARYNIGALPVCGSDGRLCGMVTDRDLVTRCVAAGRRPGQTTVKQVMTGAVVAVEPDMEAEEAAKLMGQRQVRRLPVVQNERLCGMVSLGDLIDKGAPEGAAHALGDICSNVSQR